jgi:hypothetical protein
MGADDEGAQTMTIKVKCPDNPDPINLRVKKVCEDRRKSIDIYHCLAFI